MLPSFLKEALEPHHIDYINHQVDGLGDERVNKLKRISGHVMGDSDTIRIPLDSNNSDPHHDIEPHADVHDFLTSHGYSINHYKKGLAMGQDGRLLSIGKVLNRHKAPNHIVKAFTNDPRRGNATHTNLEVAITHNPLHVAAMSTGRGWTSCMDMDGGENRHFIPRDLEHGTHVAYLVKKTDKNIDNPIARIALKPHHGENAEHVDWDTPRRSNDVILRPERSAYGTSMSEFESSVRNWSEQHFPAQPGKAYVKHPSLYNDDSNDLVHAHDKETYDKLADNKWTAERINLTRAPTDVLHDLGMRAARTADNNLLTNVWDARNHTPETIKSIYNEAAKHGNGGYNDSYRYSIAQAIMGATGHDPHLFHSTVSGLNVSPDHKSRFNIALTSSLMTDKEVHPDVKRHIYDNHINDLRSLLNNNIQAKSAAASATVNPHIDELRNSSYHQPNDPHYLNAVKQVHQLYKETKNHPAWRNGLGVNAYGNSFGWKHVYDDVVASTENNQLHPHLDVALNMGLNNQRYGEISKSEHVDFVKRMLDTKNDFVHSIALTNVNAWANKKLHPHLLKALDNHLAGNPSTHTLESMVTAVTSPRTIIRAMPDHKSFSKDVDEGLKDYHQNIIQPIHDKLADNHPHHALHLNMGAMYAYHRLTQYGEGTADPHIQAAKSNAKKILSTPHDEQMQSQIAEKLTDRNFMALRDLPTNHAVDIYHHIVTASPNKSVKEHIMNQEATRSWGYDKLAMHQFNHSMDSWAKAKGA